MRRRVVWVAFGIGVAAVVSLVAYVRLREQSGRDFEREARRVLSVSLSEATELEDIDAAHALALLEKASKLHALDRTSQGLQRYAQALVHYRQRDLIFAEGELTAARRILGATLDVHVLASAIAREGGELDLAEREVRAALARSPNHARARLMALDLALDRNDGARAFSHAEHLLESTADSAAVRNRAGLALAALGRRPEAEAEYREAVRLEPCHHQAWINLGRSRAFVSDPRGARAAFERAVACAEGNPDAHLGKGLALEELGDIDGAERDLRRAAELDPRSGSALLALGDIRRSHGDIAGAVRFYRDALEREDRDPAAWIRLGNGLLLSRKLDQAETSFREALRRAPNLAAAYNGLGAVHLQAGQKDDARAAFRRASELDPIDPVPKLNLALLR